MGESIEAIKRKLKKHFIQTFNEAANWNMYVCCLYAAIFRIQIYLVKKSSLYHDKLWATSKDFYPNSPQVYGLMKKMYFSEKTGLVFPKIGTTITQIYHRFLKNNWAHLINDVRCGINSVSCGICEISFRWDSVGERFVWWIYQMHRPGQFLLSDFWIATLFRTLLNLLVTGRDLICDFWCFFYVRSTSLKMALGCT